MLNSVEIFSGAGGLAMGLGLAGFEGRCLVERDKWACDTLKENQRRNLPILSGWRVNQSDVRDFDFTEYEQSTDLVAGGPPCQPFSLGGKHKGRDDTRDMFPTSVDVVRRVRPKAFIFENVKGLTRQSFSNYFGYIILQLTYPEVRRRVNEDWPGHLSRLERFHTKGSRHGLTYNVLWKVLDAADFGVPQRRQRVFIVGFRSDIDAKWTFPEPTHSREALLESQWVTGEYWDRHEIARRDRPEIPANIRSRIERKRGSNLEALNTSRPWKTVRDAICDLPEPTADGVLPTVHNHRFQPGAKSYAGHTGSPLDSPGKALKAGDHGVPGGENMLVREDGTVRYFTVRESARLQTFPDSFVFHGSWTETMRQLGNAVPVLLGYGIARKVAESLISHEQKQLCHMIKRLAR